ncbi:MAG: FtsX-like permease family protein [Clostridiales bacterium]|nr:FtsX-like permease family protein [Clostridiales bacterium]
MVIGLKDGAKLFGISVVCFCAVFVCTFFLNYYIDARAIDGVVSGELRVLYDANMTSAKFTCAITGGVLCLIAVVMTVFYVKLFIDGNAKRFGILKAMGYSDTKIALSFWVFGLSTFIGAAIGYGAGHAVMPLIYREMTVDGLPAIAIGYHAELLVALVIAPTVAFSALACLYARLALRRNAVAMIKGVRSAAKYKRRSSGKQRGFLVDMSLSVLVGKKSVTFFVAFACFCYSAMVQMGLVMSDLSSIIMGVMILVIGVVLGVTALFMAITTAINANKSNIAVMKAFGYSAKERSLALLVGYVPFALFGFALGTVYQHVLLTVMVNVVFGDVATVAAYRFGAGYFFITLGSFVVLYAGAMAAYAVRISRVPIKEIMASE